MASNLSTESVRSLERHLDEVSLAAELELAMVWPRNFTVSSEGWQIELRSLCAAIWSLEHHIFCVVKTDTKVANANHCLPLKLYKALYII